MEDLEKQPLAFSSGWMELFVPLTPFAQAPPQHLARFVGLDDLNDVFYDIDYDTSYLKNQVPWQVLALHEVKNPAIVFRPEQFALFANPELAILGFLVDINHRSEESFEATVLGRVAVKRLPQEFMNWEAIKSLKYPELADELRAGLLRRAYNKNPETADVMLQRRMPGRTAGHMSRQWYKDPTALNFELDKQFAGVVLHNQAQKWILRPRDAPGR